MKKIFTLILLISAYSGFAQQKVVADKIVGIVGDKIILKSDVFNEILDRRRRGEQVPDNAECYIMEQILTLKGLVLQAEKDSILVSDEEIDALLDNQIRGFIQQYGSKEQLEEVAGRTIYQIKEDFRQSFKERELAKRMRDKIVESVRITPQEVKAYWEKIPKDSLPFYESEVEVCEIVVYPKAARDFEKLSIDELNDYKRQIESGESRIETLARLYSDDPAAKENSGQYALNRTEKAFDPAFVSNAFRLKEKQVSPVFKSKFGYHIIQMVSRAGDDAIVRHILRIPKITETEINASVFKLDTVRSRLIAGSITFGEAASKFSEDENARFTGGCRQGQNGTYLTIDQLDKDMVLMLDKMKPGEYSKPTLFSDERQKKGVRIVYLKSRTDPHRENLKDDYNRIAQRALEIKKNQALEKWFASKVPTYYIMIDDEIRNCGMLGPWLQYAVKTPQ